MPRTQVELTEEQMKALRLLSAATGKSIDELIRNAIDRLVLYRIAQAEDRADRAIRVAGMFSSGKRRREYLAEAFQR